MRTNPALKHRQMLPLLALTGNVREEDLKECFASGMSAHLAKPFDRHDLAEKIEQLTRRSRAA